MYCCGSATLGYPPLRILKPANMPSTNLRKRLSELKLLMERLVARLREMKKWIDRPTMEEANRMFQAVAGLVEVPQLKRKRRTPQLLWTTVAGLLQENKRHRVDAAEEEEEDASSDDAIEIR